MWFTDTFYKHIMFRHSCGNCHFTNLKRPSDITIADFWGWEKTDPNFNADDKGVNLVLVNTEKGRKLFEAVRDRMEVINARAEDVMQPNLSHPSEIHPQRMQFEEEYRTRGFNYVFRKYREPRLPMYIGKAKRAVKRIIKWIIRYDRK